jgi:xylulokinase
VRASGGGAKSPFWRGLLADISNKRVVTLETQEGSAYGAALLALAGTGAYASVPEVCRAVIRETESVSPEAADAAFYAKAHRVYQALLSGAQTQSWSAVFPRALRDSGNAA